MDKFLDFIQRRAERTYEWYQRHLESFVNSIPDLSIANLKTHHIQSWIDSHAAWADGTKHGAWRAVHRCFRWAVRQDLMDRNPAENVEKPGATRRENVISDTHYQQMLRKTRDQEFKDLITVAWECGPRPQELLAIEARHVEHQNGRFMFPRDEAKGKKRVRYVYLTPPAMDIVKRLAATHKRGKLFRNIDGLPWTPNSTNCRFGRWKKKLGVKYALVDFRHTWQTRLLKSGVDPITVATLAGHVDASMLARVYQHLSQDPEYLRGALNRGSVSSSASDGREQSSTASASTS